MSLFSVFLTLQIFYAGAFKLYNVPFHFHTLVQKRSTQPKQCVLVLPSLGESLPSTGGGNGDQSPLLPGPSRGSPDTIQAQSACGDIGATSWYLVSAGTLGIYAFLHQITFHPCLVLTVPSRG